MTELAHHPYLAGAESLVAVLDSMVDLQPAFLPEADQRRALQVMRAVASRALAMEAMLMAAAGGVAEADGHRDVAAWLAHRSHASLAAGRRAQRLGDACDRRWQHLGRVLVTGCVDVDQGHVIVAALDDLAAAATLVDVGAEEWGRVLALAEAHLVEQAAEFGPRELRRLGERILAVVAPELAEQLEEKELEAAERRARRRTSLRIQHLGDGTALIRARVPESVALRLTTSLEAFTNPRRAEGRCGSDGETVPYDRRLGEAFCSLLECLDPARLPLHGGDATTLVITMDLAALVEGLGAATLADGSRITAREARRMACTADLVPAVLGTRSVPLDLGRTARLFSPGQRKALALRDRECRAQGCSIPSTWTEAHHLEPWSRGGRTDLANAVLLCSRHHHLIHDDRYLHDRLPNGDIRFARRR
ncbi:HNH endonuclease signature motif containing protein [Nocardioides pantholopis]|uniref:HNH endonuclease signature motif containing protein n=1 Tax=Nocardioides pantholopis TaxID=2483798 RepID=UPI000F089D21|nr:HNH endonuclease signature motif containing protein [Nocardioides pantholopis]